METMEELGHYAQFTVRWPLLYGNDELLGQGTVLNISRISCRLAGTMPVAVGMLLKLWACPGQKEDELYVAEARVLWVRRHEFGLELRRMGLKDHQWLVNYLEGAERRANYRRGN